MKKRSLIFIIPAVLLVGVLGYALINALSIYIPQEKAQNSYRELKESVRIVATTGADNKETSGSSETGKNDESEKRIQAIPVPKKARRIMLLKVSAALITIMSAGSPLPIR